MEKQPNVKLPVVFLSDYYNDPITNKPKCTLTIGLPTSTMDNFRMSDDKLFQENIIYDYVNNINNACWIKHGVILNIKTNKDINCNICDPFIFKDSDGTYKMWYSSLDSPHWRIHYAISLDGISWNEYGIVLDLGADGDTDDYYVRNPSVLKDSDGTYKMWYTGNDGFHSRIHYATSPDGINWTKHGVVVDIETDKDIDEQIRDPFVFKDLDGTYKMWYTGHDGSNWKIHYATSSGGINWTKHGVVLNTGAGGNTDDCHVWSPSVLKDLDGTYKMWYAGSDGSNWRIHYATSSDGINWTKHGVVVDVGANGDTDSIDICDPFVLRDSDGICKMWYTGYNVSHYRIHYATFHNLIANTMGSTSESLHPLLRNPNVLIAGKSLTEDWGAKKLILSNGTNNPYTLIAREIQLESDDQRQLEVLVNNTIKDITDKLKQVKQQSFGIQKRFMIMI